MNKPTIVVFAPRRGLGGAWGKGETLQEAKQKCRYEGGRLSEGYRVVTFGPETEFIGVTDMGYYSWRGPDPETTDVPPRKQQGRHKA